MPDYTNTKIYTIENTVGQPICIGHTTMSLKRRWNNYRSNHQDPKRRDYNMKISELMRDYGFDNFSIELLEDYPCKNRREAEAQEGYHMLLYRDDLGIPICNTIKAIT